MDGSVQFYLSQSIAPSTRRSYNVGQKRYEQFCNMLGRAPLPVFETQLCQFCAFIADQGLSHQTIKCYLSAIRFHQIFSGLPDPGISNMVRLEQLLKGIKSVQARLKKNQRPRLPITPSILKCMKAVWIPTSNLRIKRDNKMLWAACTFSFMGSSG